MFLSHILPPSVSVMYYWYKPVLLWETMLYLEMHRSKNAVHMFRKMPDYLKLFIFFIFFGSVLAFVCCLSFFFLLTDRGGLSDWGQFVFPYLLSLQFNSANHGLCLHQG